MAKPPLSPVRKRPQQIISELAVLLNNTTRQQTATADSLRRYVRGTKVKTRDNEMPEMAETKLTPEIMAVMRKIAPKYDEWALGDDARIASLDVLAGPRRSGERRQPPSSG